MRRVMLATILSAVPSPACGGGQGVEPKKDSAPATPAGETAPAEPASEAVGETAGPMAKELSEEDKRLIAADPATLDPEERRKRGYALRRKIMLDPDSEAAKTIAEGQAAIERGELQVPPHLLGESAGEPDSSTPGPGPVLSAPAPKQPPGDSDLKK